MGQHKASSPGQKGTKATPQQQDQNSRPIPSQQPGVSDRPLSFTGSFPSSANPSRQQAFPLPQPPASPSLLQHRWSPEKEKDAIASMTLFRTGNFFVRAFAPRLQADSLAQTGARGNLLERISWASAEKQRLLAAQTRLLPRIETFTLSQRRPIPFPGWLR